MKTYKWLYLPLLAVILLAGCEYEETPVSSLQNATDIASSGVEAQKVQEVAKKTITKSHSFDFKGQTINFETSYGIDEKFINSWYYTIPNSVDLAIKTNGLPSGVEVAVNNLYVDVTVSSRYSRFNGARQDSMNLSYSTVGNGGFSFNDAIPYTQPFQIEGVNQSEIFLQQWNGYGISSTSYLTENEIRKYSDGVVLRSVWLISIKQADSDEIFSTSLTDKIYMKSPEYISEVDKDKKN